MLESIIPDHSIQKLGLKHTGVFSKSNKVSIPDHSIQKLGLKLECTTVVLVGVCIPDHSIQKLGLKQSRQGYAVYDYSHSRPFHSEIRIETVGDNEGKSSCIYSRPFHSEIRIETR